MELIVALLAGLAAGYLIARHKAKESSNFLDLAEAKLEPVQKSLERFESKISEVEKARAEAQGSLKTEVRNLTDMQQLLQRETHKIASALKSNTVRGRWGEIQLRRVVEMAGMVSHCDFFEQQSQGGKRPDMIVRLPAGRQIIVDAKAPLDAYLEAADLEDEGQRTLHLKRHADQIRSHIRQLSSKGYTEHFQPTPEFVVLFLPGEIFYSAALSQDPSLIEAGAEKGVIIATPTTLIALLRSVAFGWKQEAISNNAREIARLGQELHKRLQTLGNHWSKVGRSLSTAVKSYNEAIGSFEKRVLVTAREFDQFTELEGPKQLDVIPHESGIGESVKP